MELIFTVLKTQVANSECGTVAATLYVPEYIKMTEPKIKKHIRIKKAFIIFIIFLPYKLHRSN